MHRRFAAATISLALLVPAAARGQDANEPSPGGESPAPRPGQRSGDDAADRLEPPGGRTGGQRRVAVLLLAFREVDAEVADSLTEVAIGAVAARGGISIVGKEEFQSQLGQGEASSLECVSSTPCLGRIGVQLDVDELIAGTVGRRGESWIFNINRIDIQSGELVGRAFREVGGGLGAVAAAIQAAIPTLYEEAREAGALVLETNVDGAEISVDGVLVGIFRGEPVRLGDVSPGRHEITVNATGHYEWRRVVDVGPGATLQIDVPLEAVASGGGGLSPLFWIGTGVAIGAGVAALYFGFASQEEPPQGGTRMDAVEFVDDRETEAMVANVAMGAAAAGILTAVVGLLVSDFGGDGATARASVSPIAGGAIVGVGGSM